MKKVLTVAANLTALATITATLTACGGGGSSSSTSNQLRTGVLVDAAVSGIAYTTPTQSGVTNAAGEFQYRGGESVAFSLGEMPLGQAQGASTVTIFDITGANTTPQNINELFDMLGQEAEHRPFHKAINIGVLLQTLDANSVPDNGIEITTPVAALFDEASLWLDQPYTRFQTNHRLRQILRTAHAEELLTSRTVVQAYAALNHMWSEAGLTQTFYQPRTIEINTDGVTGAEQVLERDYNTQGRLTYVGNDTNADGNMNNESFYTYNTAGAFSAISHDSNGDGALDRIRTYTYTDFGQLASDITTTGTNAELSADIRTYNDNALFIAQELRSTNGTQYRRWGDDGTGTRTFIEYDNDGDGSWDRRDEATYDAQDRWVDRSVDLDLDGTTDQRWTRAYNALGMLTAETKDTDNDGTVDERKTWTFNSNGQLLEHVIAFPTDANNTGARRITKTYDAQHRLLTSTTDYGDDETIEEAQENVYTTQQDGSETHVMRWDYDGDNAWDRINTLIYDANGKLTQRTRQDQIDTANENTETTTYTYDDQDRLIQTTSDDRVVDYSDFVELPLAGTI